MNVHKRLIPAIAIVLTLAVAPAAGAATLNADPSNFRAVFSSAAGGDVIQLASGNYGDFSGGSKPATVTIVPQPGAAATISPQFSSASNVRLEGMTIGDLLFSGSTHDVSVANSRFTGMAVVRSEQMNNANILFEGNTHEGINVCGNCYEGRLEVIGDGPGPSGVTVRNSRFGPGGNADGMQIGADGVRVLNNEFTGIRQIGAVHSDSLQLYGSSNTLIAGNYFHDNDVAIMAPDGGENEFVSDNVFVGDEYRGAVQFGSHEGSSFIHNTVLDMTVHLTRKQEVSRPSRNLVIRDNLMVRSDFNTSDPAGGCSACTVSFNQFDANRYAEGTQQLVGAPVFLGGARPANYVGYELAARSPGKGAASDRTDRGARITKPPAAPGAPAPGAPAGKRKTRPSAKLSVRKRIRWNRLRRGLRVRVTTKEPIKLSFKLRRKGAKRPFVAFKRTMKRAGSRTFVLKPRRARLGHRRAQILKLKVVAANATGGKKTFRATIRVRRR